MNTLILSMKVFLISAGILSLAMGIKFSFPVAVNEIPAIWSVVLSWLKPPYLYLIINGIIITIAATSRFHQTQSKPPPVLSAKHPISVRATPPPEFSSFSDLPVVKTVTEESIPAPPAAVAVYESDDFDDVVEVKPVVVNGSQVDIVTEEEIMPEIVNYESDGLDKGVELKPVIVTGSEVDMVTEEEKVPEIEADDLYDELPVKYNTSRQETISSEIRQLESLFPAMEKPLVPSRFGHRQTIRTNPEVPAGKALRVTKPKKNETLESTWKMITEGRHVPLTRPLKKPETFEQHDSHATPIVDHVPKSETFNDGTSYESSLRIRKEPSPGQDELNRRVEEFIKKVNEDMRIQRQESLNQCMEMINRGV